MAARVIAKLRTTGKRRPGIVGGGSRMTAESGAEIITARDLDGSGAGRGRAGDECCRRSGTGPFPVLLERKPYDKNRRRADPNAPPRVCENQEFCAGAGPFSRPGPDVATRSHWRHYLGYLVVLSKITVGLDLRSNTEIVAGPAPNIRWIEPELPICCPSQETLSPEHRRMYTSRVQGCSTPLHFGTMRLTITSTGPPCPRSSEKF
jgi:hypothetical protein